LIADVWVRFAPKAVDRGFPLSQIQIASGQDLLPREMTSALSRHDDVDIIIGKAVAGIPAHMKECILKAGCIAAGEELFRIGRIAASAKGRGASLRSRRPSSLRIAPRCDFCGIWTGHSTYAFFAAIR
jgi:hypothetical protein